MRCNSWRELHKDGLRAVHTIDNESLVSNQSLRLLERLMLGFQSFIFANYASNLKSLSMFLQWECPRRAMCSAKLLHGVIRVFELHLGFPFCAINLLHLIPGIEPDFSLWCGREYRTSRGQLFDTVEEGGLRASAPYVSSTEIAEQENEHGLDILHDRVNVLKRV
jgi:hypothetical protein